MSSYTTTERQDYGILKYEVEHPSSSNVQLKPKFWNKYIDCIRAVNNMFDKIEWKELQEQKKHLKLTQPVQRDFVRPEFINFVPQQESKIEYSYEELFENLCNFSV